VTDVPRFADLPQIPEADALHRTRPPAPGRRVLLRTLAGAATAVAFGALETVNAAVARAAYFHEYKDTKAGPCGPHGYAHLHTEHGLRCGPSQICPTCCWSQPSTRFNRTGWHRAGAVGSTFYAQRPNQCWAGTYEAWRWKFSDGRTYRCSDGYRFTDAGATKTICPWSV
jgi:hypothetical protein